MSTFADLDPQTQRKQMESQIRTYFDGCNEADIEKMTAQFDPGAVHYFPPGLDGPWVGSRTIAENWRRLTMTIGSAWSIDRLIAEPESLQAVIEFTHYKPGLGGFVRGDEWYKFDPDTGLITEIRACYAAASDGRDKVELQGYDYRGEGYHLECPVARPLQEHTPAETTRSGAPASGPRTGFSDLDPQTQRKQMESQIRTYFDGCNEADIEKMTAQFDPEAVHYFPPGLNGPWVSSRTIAENWTNLVHTIGSGWSIDRLIAEPESLQAVIEFTHYKTGLGGFLRGSEWYRFDPETGLITEIRAFYASAVDGREKIELEGYDYRGEGYHLECPVARPHPDADPASTAARAGNKESL
ncbi:nuclear transport factor 2 family protein [Rhodococcus sp. NPDC056960]|uniref:nuclear transport factor 2 family protein n=1 Tax=Rhodococcus sp. NPDC056960 TaxID=3345982 RepID=UPI00363927F4